MSFTNLPTEIYKIVLDTSVYHKGNIIRVNLIKNVRSVSKFFYQITSELYDIHFMLSHVHYTNINIKKLYKYLNDYFTIDEFENIYIRYKDKIRFKQLSKSLPMLNLNILDLSRIIDLVYQYEITKYYPENEVPVAKVALLTGNEEIIRKINTFGYSIYSYSKEVKKQISQKYISISDDTRSAYTNLISLIKVSQVDSPLVAIIGRSHAFKLEQKGGYSSDDEYTYDIIKVSQLARDVIQLVCEYGNIDLIREVLRVSNDKDIVAYNIVRNNRWDIFDRCNNYIQEIIGAAFMDSNEAIVDKIMEYSGPDKTEFLIQCSRAIVRKAGSCKIIAPFIKRILGVVDNSYIISCCWVAACVSDDINLQKWLRDNNYSVQHISDCIGEVDQKVLSRISRESFCVLFSAQNIYDIITSLMNSIFFRYKYYYIICELVCLYITDFDDDTVIGMVKKRKILYPFINGFVLSQNYSMIKKFLRFSTITDEFFIIDLIYLLMEITEPSQVTDIFDVLLMNNALDPNTIVSIQEEINNSPRIPEYIKNYVNSKLID